VQILLRQSSSPFFYLLLAAGVISFIIGEKIDGAVILIFVSINVLLGFIQEFRAERTVLLLKNIISQKVKVLRDGEVTLHQKRYLVQGDLLAIAPGDIIPAECRIIEAENMLIDESALTGESVPAVKNADPLKKEEKEVYKSSNILFAGTAVISGKARAVVIGTGKDTQLGQLIDASQAKRPQGVYEKNLIYFCKLILKIVLATVFIIFLLNLIIKGTDQVFEFSLFCVALIVSILPEALPAIVIFALSRGSLRMAKENVVVKRLSAIEDLGNVEILCTDKTGTLTQNILSLEKIVSPVQEKAVLYALLGSGAGDKKAHGVNPFDRAIALKADYKIMAQVKKAKVADDFPFDSFRMRSSVAVQNEKGQRVLICKGAPEAVIKSCSLFSGSFTRRQVQADIQKEGTGGKRVLAVAFKKLGAKKASKKDERAMTFLGYFVFEDPLKSTAQEAILLSKKLGVKVKILTGDSREVAAYVSKKIGLIEDMGEVIVGRDLEKLQGEEFHAACQDISVFARVAPDTKQRIIASLQRTAEVAFLGEGINDVPALKAANVGIAVAEATDVAKEASDVVLLKKDLRVIVNGIKDGRVTFANINKYIKATLASNFGNFYSIAAISLFINFLPMLPVQILLGNLLSDFPLISVATDSVDIEELRQPKLYQLHNILPLIVALGLVSTVFDFIFFIIFYKYSPAHIQTLWFIESILTEIFLIYIIRTRHQFWKAKMPGRWLNMLTVFDAIVVMILPFTALGAQFFYFAAVPFSGLLIVLGLVVCYLALSELVKLIYYRHFDLTSKFDNR
jgi:Mg2+-importing ATPase